MYLRELLKLLPADEVIAVRSETEVEVFPVSEYILKMNIEKQYKYIPVTAIIPNGHTDIRGFSYLEIDIIEPAFE